MPTLHDLRLFARHHLLRRAYDHPARDHEMGVVPLGYEPAGFAEEIRSFSDRFDVREAAHVSYRHARHPIFAIATRNSGRAQRRLLVLSGVHGNEQAGILSVPELLRRVHAAGARFDDVALHVLTPVNAVGAAELSRFNAEGYDVNRDFVLFLTPEARLVRDAFESVRPHFVVSLHEGPQDATFFFANSRVPRDRGDRLLAALQRGGTVLAEKDYFGARLRPPGLSPSTPATRALLRLWSGTLRMMAVNEYAARRGIPEITLESGWRSPDRDARLRAHVDLVLALCDELASEAAAERGRPRA